MEITHLIHGNPVSKKGIERDRREPRYTADVELHVDEGARRYVTTTREVSRAGLFFFASPVPDLESRVELVVHPEDDQAIALGGVVRYAIEDIGAGVELGGMASEIERWQHLVARIAGARSVWAAIGQFVRKPSGRSASAAGIPEHKELVRIGETCAALRILFELAPAVAPEAVFPRAHLEDGLLRTELLTGVSREPVGLRLHAKDRLRTLHIGLLANQRGYAAVVPPRAPADSYHLYHLSGEEELAVSPRSGKTFPRFAPAHLAAIIADSAMPVRSTPRPFGVAAPKPHPGSTTASLPPFPREHLPIAPFARWTRFAAPADLALEELLDELAAETRVYQIRGKRHTVRLLRQLRVLVRDNPSDEGRAGVLMQDGRRMCVLFGLETGAMEIRPLNASDELMIAMS